MRVRPHSAGDLAYRDLAPRRPETRSSARDLGVMPGQREAERDRFGEDSVAAADHRCLGVLTCPPREGREEAIASRHQLVGGVAQ